MTIPTLSVCMIVKNEASVLKRCLESVHGLVNQLVIVDTGSTDQTVQIAADFGAQIISFPWIDDFSAARNAGLAHAKGEWVFSIDADEVLDAQSQTKLRRILDPELNRIDTGGFRVLQRNQQPAGEVAKYQDVIYTRLFRNHPNIRYEGLIHEQVNLSIYRMGLKVVDTDILLFHDGYTHKVAQGDISRARRNLDLIQKALAQSPDDPYLLYQAGITYKSLNEPGLAMQNLQRALQLGSSGLSPDVLDILHMKLAQLYSAQSNFALSVQHAETSLALNPDNAISLYLAALGHIFQKDVRAAYPYFLRLSHQPASNFSDLDNVRAMLAYCQQVLGIK